MTARRLAWVLGLYAIGVAWVLLLFSAFRPGRMSVDSIHELTQAAAGSYTNWHPPAVSWLMGFAVDTAGSPWPVLALQLAMLSLGLVVLCHRARKRRALVAILFVLSLICPAIWSLATVLWKDVLMAGLLLCGVACLRWDRPWPALLLFVCASLTRHNALVAAPPLIVPAVVMLAKSLRVRLASGLVALVAMTLAPHGVELLFRAEDQSPSVQLLAHDIAGIFAREPGDAEKFTFADTNGAKLARTYSPHSTTSTIFPAGELRGYSWFAPRKQAIERAWARAVMTHPRAYLAHRWAVFRRAMSLDGLPSCYPLHEGIEPNRWGYSLRNGSRLLASLRRIEDSLRPTLLFRGWVWMALALGLAVFSWRRRDDDLLPFFVATSGFLYSAEYLLVGTGCDFRFVYWTVVAACAAGLMLAHPPIESRRANPERQPGL